MEREASNQRLRRVPRGRARSRARYLGVGQEIPTAPRLPMRARRPDAAQRDGELGGVHRSIVRRQRSVQLRTVSTSVPVFLAISSALSPPPVSSRAATTFAQPGAIGCFAPPAPLVAFGACFVRRQRSVQLRNVST